MSGYVGPEHWDALRETSPATRDQWVARLGGGGAARIAVQGAIGRGQLVTGEDGRLHLLEAGPVQLGLGLPALGHADVG